MRNFEAFRETVIGRLRTRFLALANVVGYGMRGGGFEQDLADMQAGPTADRAKSHREIIAGFKTAPYPAAEWRPVEEAMKAGEAAGIPVMLDLSASFPERPLETLLTEKLRPGDICTHCFSGNRRE